MNKTLRNFITLVLGIAIISGSAVFADRSFSLPDQTGQSGKFLTTDGVNPSWATAGGGGGVTSITGTANQVIASASTGAVTLSLPQSIATTSTPQFARIGINMASTTGIGLDTFVDGTSLTQGLRVHADTSTRSAFGAYVTGDANLRFLFTANGNLQWGDGTAGADTNLYRTGVGVLNTDGNLTVGTPGTTSSSVDTLAGTQTLTNKTLTSPALTNPTISGAGAGVATLVFSNTASSATMTFPTGNTTLVGTSNTQTLTNKTITSPSINALSNLTSNGLIKTTGGNGTLSIATAGTDYLSGVATDSTLQGNGQGASVLGFNLGNPNTWTGATTVSTAPFTISGNQSAAAWTTNGIQLKVMAATLNDSTSSGSVSLIAVNAIGQPTLTSTSAVNYTTATTLYIAGSPTASTNVTEGNGFSLYIASGNAGFLGGLSTAVSNTSSNFSAVGGTITSTSSVAQLQFGGSTSINYRGLFNGTSTTTMGVNNNYSNLIIGGDPINTASTGTNAWLANMVINPIGTIGGTTTATNSASLYIGGAASGATNNYSLYIDSGNMRLNNGSLTLGTAGNKLNIATGTNASVGTATLVGGTVTVSTTAVTASSKIFLTDATTGALTNIGTPTVGTIVAGTSFVINSSNVLDTSNINWFIIN